MLRSRAIYRGKYFWAGRSPRLKAVATNVARKLGTSGLIGSKSAANVRVLEFAEAGACVSDVVSTWGTLHSSRRFAMPLVTCSAPVDSSDRLCQASEVRLSELVSAFSVSLDITEGQPAGHAMDSCLIGMRLADELKLSVDDQAAYCSADCCLRTLVARATRPRCAGCSGRTSG